MKKAICLLLGVLVVIFTALPSHADKMADFDISDPFIMVGEDFEVDVSVYDDGTLGDLSGFGFDVDPLLSLSLITFNGYNIGPGFTDMGFGNYINGLYDPLYSDPPPVSGADVLLATLLFTANDVGTDMLNIEGIFDGAFYGLFYLGGDESILGSTEITVNPIPEPATILLVGTGLAGLAGLRRKSRKAKAFK